MSHSPSIGRALVAAIISVTAAAPRLSAQALSADDSMPRIHVLAPIRVEASRGRSWSSRFDALAQIRQAQYENRQLARQLAAYDREANRLESHLVYLKTVVTDSLRHDIAATDSATAATRAERLRLEERLRLTGASAVAVSDSVGGRS